MPPKKKTARPLETIDTAHLRTITGGAMRWPLWTYKVGNYVAGLDPAAVAANFIM